MANETEELRRQLAEASAKIETLMALAMRGNDAERAEAAEKAAKAAKRKAVKDKAIEVARAAGKSQPTHLAYVTGGYYHRNGKLYDPGSVVHIPASDEPSVEWEAFEGALPSKPEVNDAAPLGEVKPALTAIAQVKRDEEAGKGKPTTPPTQLVGKGKGGRASDEDVG